MDDKITLKFPNWKINTEERSRGRMKLTIKLNRQETEAFTAWKNTVQPPDMGDEDFYRRIFFGGVQAFNKVLEDAAQEMMKDPEARKRLEEAGVKLASEVTEESEAPVTVTE